MEKPAWENIKKHYNFLMDLPKSGRKDYLSKIEKKDPELADQLQSMLKVDEEEITFLDKPALSKIKELETPDFFVGKEIDRYKLMYLIGVGGMGNVYLAERTDLEAHQQVVVKIMNTGYLSKSLRRRFDLERRILSRLNHPHITRIYDGGITEQGLPYIVMEYIDGKPLMEFIGDNKLTLNQRLELFLDIASAVSYAHQNFILHRDLKPANILVTHHGIVKVIDFGIAKIMEGDDIEEENQITQTGIIPLTPAYASPEQLAKKTLTLATDIYSLGVILYEMLTENKPFPVSKGMDYLTIEKWVTRRDALKPSNSISADLNGGLNLKIWKKKLTGDLDNIILKTLKKNPKERYISVSHLIEDLHRHQNNYPVVARPDSFGYRLNRYIKRHKAGVAASAILFLVLVGGITSTLWQAQRAKKERDIAQYEAMKSRQITDFVVDLFQASDPDLKASDTITAETLLHKGAANLDNLKDQPELYGELLRMVGRLYRFQRFYKPSKETLEKTLVVHQEVYGENHFETAITKVELASTLHYLNEDDRAMQLLIEATPIMIEKFGDTSQEYARILYHLGQFETNKGNYQSALNYLAKAEQIFEDTEIITEEHQDQLLNIYNRIARVRFMTRDYPGSIEYYQKSLDISYKIEGAISQNISINYYNLSNSYFQLDKIDTAELYVRKSLDMAKKLFGTNSNEKLLSGTSLLAAILLEKGDTHQAAIHAREAVDASISVYGDGNFNTGISMYTYGDILMEQKNFMEGEKYIMKATAIFERILGDSHPSLNVIYSENAGHFATMEKWSEAIDYMRRTIRVHEQFYEDKILERADLEIRLANYIQKSSPNSTEIESLLLKSYQTYSSEKGKEDEETQKIVENLVEWYKKTGQTKNRSTLENTLAF